MSNWLGIKVKTEAAEFNKVRTKILGWPEEVAKNVYWPELEKIGREGVALIRQIILTSETTTGRERARRGGDGPGRVKTRKMYNSVTSRARERQGNAFSLFVGWIRGEPGYAIFQEQGTRTGIAAMNAVGQAEVYMLERLRAVAKGRFSGSYETWDGE